MNCENPVFRDCDIVTEGIAPTDKELIKEGDKYLIKFKFNGNQSIECRPTKISEVFDQEQFCVGIYMGSDKQTEAPAVSTAIIEIDRPLTEAEEKTDIEVMWFNYDLPTDISPGDKISSCTIKFEDARPECTIDEVSQ